MHVHKHIAIPFPPFFFLSFSFPHSLVEPGRGCSCMTSQIHYFRRCPPSASTQHLQTDTTDGRRRRCVAPFNLLPLKRESTPSHNLLLTPPPLNPAPPPKTNTHSHKHTHTHTHTHHNASGVGALGADGRAVAARCPRGCSDGPLAVCSRCRLRAPSPARLTDSAGG